MRTFGIVFIQILFVHLSFGQKLEPGLDYDLPDSVAFFETTWADMDNDGLLDVIAFAENTGGETICYLFKNDAFQRLLYVGYIHTQASRVAWLVTDIDGDNRVDVLLSGYVNDQPRTLQFINQDNFIFEGTLIMDVAAKVMHTADFNQDGIDEIIASGDKEGKPFVRIYQRRSGVWTNVHDSIRVSAKSIEVFDFDADGRNDFLLSGVDEAGTKVTRAYLHETDFYFIARDVSPEVAGISAKADLNSDGNFDILLSGEDDTGQNKVLALYNDGSGVFTPEDTLGALMVAQIFAGDLDSDGKCNVAIMGLDQEGDTTNFVAGMPEVIIPHRNLVAQAWGDGERDGDLDLLQLRRTPAGYSLHMLENKTTSINYEPQRPTFPVIARIFDRLFIAWSKATDDRTARQSLTYDVSVQSAGSNLMTADFDLITGRRLNVTHGNKGTADYTLIRGDDDVVVAVQAVDNAFHAGPGSICKGSGKGLGLCSEVTTVNLGLCKNERVALKGAPRTRWFSFKHGFLADTSDLVFGFQEADTIFSLARQATCATISVYVIEPAENVSKVTESTAYVCEGEVLYLGVEPDWSVVEWSSTSKGFLSKEDSITFVAATADTVQVKVSDDNGCAIQRNIALNISKPDISTPNDAYQILRGESVRLSVEGGTSHAWTPVSGLDDPESPGPLATPRTTTTYSVTAKDSLGCVATLSILVMVEETAFVPNLFTPNGDGKNDRLKIYGLGNATSFSFAVYNREGIKVYTTHNISEVVNEGWNGAIGGVDQPAGVYYWNVAGETATGKELLLNGKRSGSIVLLR